MQYDKLTEDELITLYKNDKRLTHLAKSLIIDDGYLPKSLPQMYAFGFNAGGRPDGLWLSRGSNWLQTVKELDNPDYPVCCYYYQVDLKPDANILYINTDHDLAMFDMNFPSYWLNMDYYAINFTDYLTNKVIKSRKKYHLNLNKLRKRPGESLKSILLNNNIIFTTTADALATCEFYRLTNIDMERFKYKDWSEISKVYQGIIFEKWNISDKKMMEYLWYQSLDTSSGCIWDATCVADTTLLYKKVGGYWICN